MLDSKSDEINIILPDTSKNFILIHLRIHLCSFFPVINSNWVIVIIPNAEQFISLGVEFDHCNGSSMESFKVLYTFKVFETPNI